MTKEQLLKSITLQYLKSSDFNGLNLQQTIRDYTDVEILLQILLDEGKINLNFGDLHPNPHILAFEPEAKERQKEKLADIDLNLHRVCAYPSSHHLHDVVDRSEYSDRPYTLQMALGKPQLEFEAFDLSVLEWYRNDPRYIYINSDIGGWISISDEYSFDENTRESDKVVLQTYVFAYTENLERAVAVFYRYLSGLSPEHQQIWRAKQMSGNYKLHPEYYNSQIIGDWHEARPIFDAFLAEIFHINKMCEKIGFPYLFRNVFQDSKPKEFAFLIRPTLKSFNSFILLLDKLMSENLNKKFFKDDLILEREEERSDGKIIIRYKGTIQLLDEWLSLKFRVADPKPMENIISSFKKIRRLRQKPAHSVQEDVFDQKYFQKQREIMIDAYEAVRTIRLLFANHPRVENYEIPTWLYEGKILTY